jgi:hypothetical protein
MAEQSSKEPYVSQADRPEVRINPDTPLSELRVRDLQAILGSSPAAKSPFEVGKTPLKDFFDKDFPEVAKDFIKEIKPEKLEKPEIKEFKGEKNEKFEKHEKFEKPEIKEVKNEKLEQEPVFDPRRIPQPDPRIDRLIEAMSALVAQVTQLTNQMEELRKRGGT